MLKIAKNCLKSLRIGSRFLASLSVSERLSSASFTLIELLVTVFIIALLSTASIPAIRQFQRRADLKMTANEIRSAVLEAKNYSLAPRTGGTKIQSYSIVFYGPGYTNLADTPPDRRKNAYEIVENREADTAEIPGSLKKLPQKTDFLTPFDWDTDQADNKAEIRFGVVKQGAIINEWGTVTEAQIKIKRGTEKCWRVKVIRATGGIFIEEQKDGEMIC